MRSFVVALLLVALAFADFNADFSFKGNLTVKDLDKFKFRASALSTINGNIQAIPAKGLFWSSAAASGSILNTTASVDVIAGFHMTGMKVAVVEIPVMTLGTYLSGKAEFDPQFFYNAIAGHGSAEASVGIIGFAMPGLIELTPDNKFVNGISFGTEWTDLTKVENTPEGVTVFESSIKKCDDAEVNEYVIASEVAGRLKFGKTPVSPNSLETILEVKDYKYADPKNHLELIFVSAVVTADGKGEVDGDIVFNNITKDFATYVALRAEAAVGKNGASAKVEVNAVAEGDVNEKYRISNLVKTAVELAFKARGEVHFDYKRVSFPAGASRIVYDPVIGAGRNVYKSSAASLVLSVFAVLLAVFLLF